MKMHLYRSSRSTWCGLKISEHPGIHVARGIGMAALNIPSCKTCEKADKAEQAKEDAADAG